MFDDFKHAFQRHNNAHVQLIIINVIVFVVLGLFTLVGRWTDSEWISILINRQFTIPPQFSDYVTRPWTLVTYMFTHYGVWHIVFNMLAFYWFGRLFVEYLGSDKLVALYVLGGIAGGILYLIIYNTVPFYVNQSGFSGMIGASGAVFAVMVGVATLLPDYSFYLMFIGPVKIKYIAAVVVIISFLGTTGDNAGGEIAHMGGALLGFVYMKQLQGGTNIGGWITAIIDWVKGLFQPRRNVKVTYRKESEAARKATSKTSTISQAEIDAILDKISDGGYESLTKEEKDKLFNASKK